jgi:alpha-tubulin suppressor-like RCC1 family protein
MGSTSAEPAPAVVAIAPGNHHTCALTADGAVKCWGRNEFGQLGNGSTTDSVTPVDVVGLSAGVTAISSNGDHTCALTDAGGVKCWGYNGWGQLGNGQSGNYLTTPVDVTGLTSGVQAISAGGDHTCALLTDGSARCWGLNNYGQAGNNTSGNAWLGPVHVCASGTGFGCTGGSVLTGIARISAGGLHTCAVTTGGALCWGTTTGNQACTRRRPARQPPPSAIRAFHRLPGVAYGRSGLFLVTDVPHGAETWPCRRRPHVLDNAFGQVGNGTNSTTSPNYPEPTPQNVTGLFSGVETVTAGNATCALTIAGGVKCWGLNDVGQLGDGFSATNSSTPVDVYTLGAGVASIGGGSRHNCAVTDAGGAKCWGANDSGQLGKPDHRSVRSQPYPVGRPLRRVQRPGIRVRR